MNDEMTIAEAREQLEKTGKCPCCMSEIKAYWYPLTELRVRVLKKLYMRVVETNSNEIDVADAGLTFAERSSLSILRFHALIAKVKDENGHHKRRKWLITSRGAQFIRNMVAVPAKVKAYSNRVVDHSEETVTIIDVLGQDPRVPPTAPFEQSIPTRADTEKIEQATLIDIPPKIHAIKENP